MQKISAGLRDHYDEVYGSESERNFRMARKQNLYFGLDHTSLLEPRRNSLLDEGGSVSGRSITNEVTLQESLPLGFKMKRIAQISLPIIVSYFVQKLQEVINLAMLGHQTNLDKEKLTAMINGAGLGNMTLNLIGLSIIYGMNSTIETLSSQAWGAG